MLPTGRCRKCSAPTRNLLCDTCLNYIRCNRCYRYLPPHLYHNDDGVCNACQDRNAYNVGRYAHDRLIGDRTWTGTQDDMSVSDFVRRIDDDVISAYDSAVVENIAIMY